MKLGAGWRSLLHKAQQGIEARQGWQTADSDQG